MANFYHVYVMRNKDASKEQVEEELDLHLDWFRYYAFLKVGVYIVYSDSEARDLVHRLSPFAKPEGSVFVCKLDVTNRQGWMSKQFWEWLRKLR
jgi:hypothetical protein